MISKRKINTYSLILVIGIFLLLFFMLVINSNSSKLYSFTVEKLEKSNGVYVLNFEENRNADLYKIIITDSKKQEIYTKEAKTTNVNLGDLIAKNGDELSVKVIAFNVEGKSIESKNEIKIIWDNPSFSENHSHYIEENKNYEIAINGDITHEEYSFKAYYGNEVIYEEKLKDSKITLPYSIVKPYSGRITLTLSNESTLVDKLNVYVDTMVVGNVEILTPDNNINSDYLDFFLKFTGGTNSTRIYLNIYDLDNKSKLVKTIDIVGYSHKILASDLKQKTNYKLELVAIYMDYLEIAKTDSINIYIGEIPIVNPVYIDYNPSTIKAGSKIELKTKTEDSLIFYTTDGSDPLKYGKRYEEAFTIIEDMTIKAYALKYQYTNSDVNTYSFKIGHKKPIIYLSPSNQGYNHGVTSVGYTTEKEIMNKLTNYIENRLKSYGLTVYRNSPKGDTNTYINEGKYYKADFHFAIHSNGSSEHNSQGVEIWVDSQTSNALSIANTIYDNLYSIYPYKSIGNNRGVKFAASAIGEVNDKYVKNGALVEVAFHDQKDDAKWIMDNLEVIGNNLADSILKYYQIIE